MKEEFTGENRVEKENHAIKSAAMQYDRDLVMVTRPDKNLCLNCHKHLEDGDRYCRYCGTERGKGKFIPFQQDISCISGPPIKKKYECSECHYIWISNVPGGDNAKYCPRCGKEVHVIKTEKTDPDIGLGCEQPFSSDKRPQMFTEEQIDVLLDSRNLPSRENPSGNENIIAALIRAGAATPAEAKDFPRTEKEEEQFHLAELILQMEGTEKRGYPGVRCPHCGSDMTASFGYTIRGDLYRELARKVHMQGRRDALVYNGFGAIDYSTFPSHSSDYAAYVCLSCGAEFGEFEMPEEIDHLYRESLLLGDRGRRPGWLRRKKNK